MNLIQLLTDQRAYEGITHSRWGASWNWRWRSVGDDEERRSPYPEPQTDSRSALPRKNRAWQRLRLMDCDKFFSWFFSGNMWIYSISGATKWVQPTWAHQERGARPGGLCPPRAPSMLVVGSKNPLLFHKNSSQSFILFRELLFLHKNNTMVVLLKTTSVRD